MKNRPDLSVNIAGVKLKNPVTTASGTFGYGSEFESLTDLEQIGAKNWKTPMTYGKSVFYLDLIYSGFSVFLTDPLW